MSFFGAVFILFSVFPILHVNSANILVILAFPPPSHHLWNERIVNKLAERGHNLTVLSVIKPEVSPENVHYIHLEKIYSRLKDNFALSDIIMENHYRLIKKLYDYLFVVCEASLMSDGFTTLQNYPDEYKIDLVIHDLNAGPCLLGLLHKFNYPPLVGISAFKYNSDFADIIGGHTYPAYIPVVTMPFDTNMTFLQRMENTYYTIVDYIYKNYFHISARDKLAASYYNYTLPPFQNLEQRMVVALLNIHPATDLPIPLPTNVIQIGGIEVNAPRPLPEDLENFISNSKEGTILICFGTNVDTAMLPDSKQRMIIEVVRKFPNYNFLWKFERDLSDGKISNLLVKKWLPQNDILAHPKVKLFISHAGGLSTHEATWYGVPMITLPFFLDQIRNSQKSVVAGVAKSLDIRTITSKALEDAVRAILEDPSYSERMRIRSSRFRDRPMPAMETAIWWIEYVLRDPDPVHLQSPALHLKFWQAHSYDVIAVFLVLVSSVIYFVISQLHTIFLSTKRKVQLKRHLLTNNLVHNRKTTESKQKRAKLRHRTS